MNETIYQNNNFDFGEFVAKQLNINLNSHEERNFEDREHKSRPLENVRNQDVFVIHSLYSDTTQSVNDKLCGLLFFIEALETLPQKGLRQSFLIYVMHPKTAKQNYEIL